MYSRFILFISLLSLMLLSVTGHCCCNSSRFGIQGAIATGGNLGLGIVNFTEKTEIGLTVSGKYNNARYQTKTITPVIFAGLRNHLCQCTYFAYGLDLVSTFGRNNGRTINTDYQVGPYISIEQMLTHHVMLAGWILPYQYSYQKVCCVSTSTNNFFGAGGFAINYLF